MYRIDKYAHHQSFACLFDLEYFPSGLLKEYIAIRGNRWPLFPRGG